jgi:Flp pilus assembly protein CpaB
VAAVAGNRTKQPTNLGPRLTERLRRIAGARGWPTALLARRVAAVALIAAAAVLAFRPSRSAAEEHTRVLVAAHDLSGGAPLSAGDVHAVSMLSSLAPAGALQHATAITGHVLIGPARTGEPITDVRVSGPVADRAVSGIRDAVSVPVRLADPGVAGLLRPGMRVDVIGARPGSAATPAGQDDAAPGDSHGAGVLASGAAVVTVARRDKGAGLRGSRGGGPLVLLALPADAAHAVATASLHEEVTLTLR